MHSASSFCQRPHTWRLIDCDAPTQCVKMMFPCSGPQGEPMKASQSSMNFSGNKNASFAISSIAVPCLTVARRSADLVLEQIMFFSPESCHRCHRFHIQHFQFLFPKPLTCNPATVYQWSCSIQAKQFHSLSLTRE